MTVDVRSNQGPTVPAQWLRKTPKDTSFGEMRRRLREDGCVYVKTLLPRDDVQKVRKGYFKLYEPTGIIKPGSALEEGTFNDSNDPLEHSGIGAGELPPTAEQVQAMIDAHTQPKYLQLLEHPDLRSFVKGIMDWTWILPSGRASVESVARLGVKSSSFRVCFRLRLLLYPPRPRPSSF